MCVAIVKPRGAKNPSKEALKNCEWSNRDGIGVAWVKQGTSQVNIKKDFDTLETFQRWLPLNVSQADSALIHFRLATNGDICKQLRHPFPVVQDQAQLLAINTTCEMALVHNGVLWGEGQGSKLSDTAEFVKDIMADPTIRDNVRTNSALQILISGMIGESNKLGLIYADGYTLTFGKFYKHKGVSYSNEQYKWDVGTGSYYDNKYKYQRQGFGYSYSGNKGYFDYCAVCYKEFTQKDMVILTDELCEKLYKNFHASYNAKYDLFICKPCLKRYSHKTANDTERVNQASECEICHVYFHTSRLTAVRTGLHKDLDVLMCESCMMALEERNN